MQLAGDEDMIHAVHGWKSLSIVELMVAM